jgi:muconolactone delta-isomerase
MTPTIYMDTTTTIIIIAVAVCLVILIPFILIMIAKGTQVQTLKDSYRKLKVGMTEAEVANLLGRESSQDVNPDGSITKIWQVNDQATRSVFDSKSSRSIHVTFKDGKATGYKGENINDRVW